MATCQTCGSAIDVDRTNCPSCGVSIAKPAQAYRGDRVGTSSSAERDAEVEAQRGTKRLILILVGLAVVVVVIPIVAVVIGILFLPAVPSKRR